MRIITSDDTKSIRQFTQHFTLPKVDSHKGQNGKVLIVGGSHLFHSASLWSAEIASHFVDMVHYASTEENNEVFSSLKKVFRNGIVVTRSHIKDYLVEDDVVLIGPGLDRSEETTALTHEVLRMDAEKQFVLDAGSLQMLNLTELSKLKTAPIVTPHRHEFEALFGGSIEGLSQDEIAQRVEETAKEHRSVILLKAVVDYVSDGSTTICIEGGNQGLTKGGTGDILAGLVAALRTHTDSVSACVLGSYVLKRSADQLSTTHGYWYNNSHILDTIPKVVHELFS